ncbi:LuxR family transcriptional regulator [Paractinoplanes deccanensis]|uniref:LuxR family transcriptional regulator n=1 Tax=Paractinoplanes deccanensis TaxID=113561 RepID=A0ABQ3YHS2_9ACTN|nr:AAA family ATPase [Actinoplanes deccanensis]GID79563.1 LuxR family transcriptional regulator [Actinoplanes deccanensis]
MFPLSAAFNLHNAKAFVGRGGELAVLRAAVAAPPAAVLVLGEGGVGKTRLVAEALTTTGLPPRRVIVAHCDDLREPLPLGPLLDGLRRHSPSLPDGLDPSIGVFAPYLPALAGFPVPPALNDPRAERARLLRAMASVLAALAPVVVALEDLHMADPVTLEFVAYLAAHPVPGLTVLMTAREPMAVPAAVLRLAPLSPHEVGSLAEALLRRDVLPPVFVTQLFERTAGVPFLVEEVVRSLVERHEIERIDQRPDLLGDVLGDVAVPALLRDVLLWRMRPLDEATRDILGAAAVLGMVAEARTLAVVLGVPVGEVEPALRRAADAGLLHAGTQPPRFRHTLARQVVYELVPEVARRMLHLHCARVLERQVPRPVAQLAHHYRLAGSAADHVRNAEAAADLATARGDDATAARFLLATMDHPELPRRQRARLAGKLGRSAVEGVTQAEAIPVLRRILGDRKLPPGARGELGLALGRMLRQQGEAAAGYEEIERAVPYLTHHGRRARALAILSAPDTVLGRHAEDHLRYCAAAFDAAERSGDPSAMLSVEIAELSLRLELDEPGAWPAVRAALTDERFAAHPRDHLRACLNWAQGALHTGRHDRAAQLLTVARGLPAAAEYERIRPVVELTEHALDLATGHLDGLEERILAFLARPDRLPLTILDARLYLGRLRARTGRPAEAESDLRAVIADAARVGAAWPLIPAHTALAELLGDPAHARTALDLAERKGLPAWGRSAASLLAHLAGAAG